MRIVAFLLICMMALSAAAACTRGGIETQSVILRKEVQDGTQYYFYVQYEAVIDGIPGTFEATIKVRNRAEYDRYSVGDRYVFRRPAPR